jgi:hypothetical protein
MEYMLQRVTKARADHSRVDREHETFTLKHETTRSSRASQDYAASLTTMVDEELYLSSDGDDSTDTDWADSAAANTSKGGKE